MLNTKYYILTILTLLLAGTSELHSAQYKQTNKKNKRTHYVRQVKAANTIEDSLLNVPKKKPLIVIDEKDIPLDYIIKLDSALNDYQTKYFVHTAPCEKDSVLTELLADSVYIDRLQRIPSIVELTYNSIVRDFISLYTIRRSKLTAMVLGQRDYYFPIFEDALDSEGLPFELKYLPVIESALNPKAYSPAGASGLWQFISSTGRTYGLRINSLIDERRDPIKSSKAAAQFLKHLYSIYKDWTLVIAAYNCGPGNVNKAIRRAGGVKDYWAIYPYLPRETRGYVPAFIAATYAMNYYQEHNICPKIVERCNVTDTIQVREKLHLAQIADVLDIDIEELRLLNPQFKTDIVPGNTGICNVILPTDKISQYEMYKNTILAYKVPGYIQHRPQVEPHKHVATNTKNNAKLNKNNSYNIKQKEKKVIATNKSAGNSTSTVKSTRSSVAQKQATQNKAQIASKSPAKNNDQPQTSFKYKVKAGDTLYDIALRNKVTVVNLKKWNSLNSDNLKIGQVIVVKPNKR